jgi:hypothetical protein
MFHPYLMAAAAQANAAVSSTVKKFLYFNFIIKSKFILRTNHQQMDKVLLLYLIHMEIRLHHYPNFLVLIQVKT